MLDQMKFFLLYLVNNGISVTRLTDVGHGQNRPADTNETAEGRQNNRRIEMRITSNNKI